MSRALTGLAALWPAALVLGALVLVGAAEPLAEPLSGLGGGLGPRLHAGAVLVVRAGAGYLLGMATGIGRARLSRRRQLGVLVPAAAVAAWPLVVPPLAGAGLVPDGLAGIVPPHLPPFAAVAAGLALACRR